MNVSSVVLNINSENPMRLYEFYHDVIGLQPEVGMGETALRVAEMALIFDSHSDIRGAAKEPARYLFNRSQGREFWGGIISTFSDPDGNYVQIIQFDPSAASLQIGGLTINFEGGESIRSRGRGYWGRTSSTLADPDSNLVQLDDHSTAAVEAPGA